MEMAFADEETVMEEIEKLLLYVWDLTLPGSGIKVPFSRMTYHEAMSSYGSDKPDLRYGAPVSSKS